MFALLRNHYARLACVLIIALGLRLAAGVWWQSRLGPERRFAFGDSEAYWTLAGQLARGEPYQYGSPDASVARMPGYPLLLAGLFKLAGDDPPVQWARALSAICGTLAVAAVYALGRQLFDPATGLVAACLAGIYPGTIGDSVFVLSEAPFCPLMVVQLVIAAAGWQSATARRAGWLAGLAGVLAGLATLVRPSWLLFAPFAAVLGVVFGRDRGKHLRLGAITLATLAMTMAPWWIRNWQVTGHFVPTTLQVGASLYDGLNPQADGSSEMSFVPRFEDEERKAELGHANASEPFEYRLDRRMRDAALDWATAHPGRAAQLALVKVLRLWNVWPNDAQFRSWPLRLAVLATYAPAMALAACGAWRSQNRGWPYVLTWLPAVYLTLLHTVFVSSIRYRDPAVLSLLVLAAATLVRRNSPSSEG